MAAVWSKLDTGLGSIYSDFLLVRERGLAAAGPVHPVVARGSRLNVTLAYDGDDDLSELEALGFRTLSKKVRGLATGTISLEDVERLTGHPKVQLMSFPLPPQRMLDKSVLDIHANDPAVWQRSGGTFSGTTGKGVVIGIIDDGIDIRHPFFRKTDDPLTTRIAAIWDMGLIPQTLNDPKESSPPLSLLDGSAGGTYGVEYTGDQINDYLQGKSGALEVRTRNCGGHGTHVASIAAGDGRDEYKYVGVAPEATLVVVKYMDHVVPPEVGGGEVNGHDLLKDAITYVLKKAATLTPEGANTPGMPVVVNCSFGNALGPHDGLTSDEDFLDKLLDPATSAGKIVVVAAGNEASRNTHARVLFTATETTPIDFELVDRRTSRTRTDTCYETPDYNSLYINLWYADGPNQIKVKFTVPNALEDYEGPALQADAVEEKFQGRMVRMTHKTQVQKLEYTGRPQFSRNLFTIEIVPNINGEHFPGQYTMELEGHAGMDVHMWCSHRGEKENIVIKNSDLPVEVTDNFTIGDNGGARNVITVGAYFVHDGLPHLPLWPLSSRGPLTNMGGPGPPPDKPEITAPGAIIEAASSRDTRKKSKKRKYITSMQGTSLATPHVAGVIALMLQKKKTLTAEQVRTIWQNNLRQDPNANEIKDNDGKFGRVDAKISVTKASEP